jgi:hypothetical protein
MFASTGSGTVCPGSSPIQTNYGKFRRGVIDTSPYGVDVAASNLVEHKCGLHAHTVEVTGSNPVPPNFDRNPGEIRGFLFSVAGLSGGLKEGQHWFPALVPHWFNWSKAR